MVKLTLNAEAAVIRKAKKLAAERNTSVSSLFSRLVTTMGQTERATPASLGPLTSRATGLFRMPAAGSSKDILAAALSEKYGVDR